jgi:hypothetical protein
MMNFRIVRSREYVEVPSNLLASPLISTCFDFCLDGLTENILPRRIREILEKEVEQPKKKSLRNEVDGSFVVTISEKYFPELAQRLIDLAAKYDLTINPNVKKLRVGEALSFGSGLDYDVNRVKDAHEGYKGKLLPIYGLERDFETIIKAVKEMATEKASLRRKRGMDLVSGKRSFTPTYNELKREEVGGKEVDKKRETWFSKEVKEETKKIDSSKFDRITVSTNFIKVGYDFIPINDNDLVYISV